MKLLEQAPIRYMQPICESDWTYRYSLGKKPAPKAELPKRCCYCGEKTFDGLYVWVEVAVVPYPQPRT